jgi:hypothetical protein
MQLATASSLHYCSSLKLSAGFHTTNTQHTHLTAPAGCNTQQQMMTTTTQLADLPLCLPATPPHQLNKLQPANIAHQ